MVGLGLGRPGPHRPGVRQLRCPDPGSPRVAPADPIGRRPRPSRSPNQGAGLAGPSDGRRSERTRIARLRQGLPRRRPGPAPPHRFRPRHRGAPCLRRRCGRRARLGRSRRCGRPTRRIGSALGDRRRRRSEFGSRQVDPLPPLFLARRTTHRRDHIDTARHHRPGRHQRCRTGAPPTGLFSGRSVPTRSGPAYSQRCSRCGPRCRSSTSSSPPTR